MTTVSIASTTPRVAYVCPRCFTAVYFGCAHVCISLEPVLVKTTGPCA